MNEVASNSSEKCLKNYLYDNPELSETKAKKACAELDEDFDSDTEVWILQCPKNYDPQQMMNIDLGKVEKQSKMECSVERFGNKKTLAVIVAAKSEYELVRDNIKLVKPVGKIIVNEKIEIEESRDDNRPQKRSMTESSAVKKKKSKRNT